MQASKHKKGSLQADLNLIPFIDILSTCICFLLMTTVFMHLATLDTQQGMGNETHSGEKNPPSVMVKLEDSGNLKVLLKDVESGDFPREISISAGSNGINWEEVSERLASVKAQFPDMNTALVLPSAKSKYSDMIHAMDELKKQSFLNLGISPL